MSIAAAAAAAGVGLGSVLSPGQQLAEGKGDGYFYNAIAVGIVLILSPVLLAEIGGDNS